MPRPESTDAVADELRRIAERMFTLGHVPADVDRLREIADQLERRSAPVRDVAAKPRHADPEAIVAHGREGGLL